MPWHPAGALALGVYTLGVLGRVTAEALEELDPRPATALTRLGAGPTGTRLYGVAPRAMGPVLASALYRGRRPSATACWWACSAPADLGALLATALHAFDWPAVTTTLGVLVRLTVAVDLISTRARDVGR